MCEQLLINGRQRGDVKREREREERRVAALGETLWRYKREMGNCRTASKEMVKEEARLDALHTRYLEMAEEAERKIFPKISKSQCPKIPSSKITPSMRMKIKTQPHSHTATNHFGFLIEISSCQA